MVIVICIAVCENLILKGKSHIQKHIKTKSKQKDWNYPEKCHNVNRMLEIVNVAAIVTLKKIPHIRTTIESNREKKSCQK